ncbi:MAG TPA: TonB family protein [Pyrinomonadaceae bacterium]|jgi:TonB family protein
MLKPRRITLSLLCTLLFGALISIEDTHRSVLAQEPSTDESAERERGIQLYRQGDLKGAIEALSVAVRKNQDDLIAWDSLAHALASKGDQEGARKALKRVAELRVRLFQKEFDAASEKINGGNISRLELLYKETLGSVDAYLATGVAASALRGWTEVFNSLMMQGKFLELARAALAQGQSPRWSEIPKIKARILKRPFPLYTREARENQVYGTIILSAMLTADGQVVDIRVVKGLDQSLTEESMEAARQIKFQPATVGGRPVSQYVRIDYSFNVLK